MNLEELKEFVDEAYARVKKSKSIPAMIPVNIASSPRAPEIRPAEEMVMLDLGPVAEVLIVAESNGANRLPDKIESSYLNQMKGWS